ncbi:Glycoside hydrolase [Forsythia ovata]|uniref:Glycoside hydrolase n=1 Tax=Forsythia ovata TaxID=205694 RepID=A0ABD1TP60_9LAMI
MNSTLRCSNPELTVCRRKVMKWSGYARNIIFQNIEMRNVSNPIIVDQNHANRSPIHRYPTPVATTTVGVETATTLVGCHDENQGQRLLTLVATSIAFQRHWTRLFHWSTFHTLLPPRTSNDCFKRPPGAQPSWQRTGIAGLATSGWGVRFMDGAAG